MTEEQWYVHVLGPDDIEGPFNTMEHALRHAAQINAWLTEREEPITEFTPMLWAVPTQSEWGTTNYQPTHPSVQPPTREQIAEAIYTVRAGSNEHWHKAAFRDDYLAEADAVLALFPEPGPSAEVRGALLACLKLGDDGNNHWDIDALDRLLDSHMVKEPLESAKPVSIADMAPGTTFRARLRDGLGAVDRFWFVSHVKYHRPNVPRVTSADGDRWLATCIDPSTIRDVTPPPATPEEGDRG
jgi:hypothetical protein